MNKRRTRHTTRVLVATQQDNLLRILDELAGNARHDQVGALTSIDRATAAAAELGVDVVVVHVETLTAIRQLTELTRTRPIVVVSGLPPEQALLSCVAVGARGFVWSPHVATTLDVAVTEVAAGRTYLNPFSEDWLKDEATFGGHRNGTASSETPATRQSEVLALVSQGLTNSEIADALDISTNTVKTHLQRAMRRLGAKTRHEAAEVSDR